MSQRSTARPYRDFLTPALHRRSTSAFVSTLCVCYAISVLMGSWDSLLAPWFPIGAAGVRTLMLFIATLAIYILRVAQMHVGQRTTTCPFETFFKYILRRETVQTLVFYSLSAFWFGEVYIWSQSRNAKLSWTDHGKPYERIRLNERPIYLRAMFISLAIAQSVRHLYCDYDQVVFPLQKSKQVGNHVTVSVGTATRAELLRKSGQMAQRAISTTLFVALFGSFAYFIMLRRSLWDWNFWFAKGFNSLAKTSRPGGLRGADLFGRFLLEGSYLVFLWEFTNAAFNVHVAQEPLKKGKPLTDDSKDPNGSLLNGLKAKKEVPRNVAFWELALITFQFPLRRKAIYEEIDRKDDPRFKQIVAVCLAEVNGIVARITAVQSPPTENEPLKKSQDTVELVPRIAQPLKDDKIAGPGVPPKTRIEKVEAFAGDFVRTHGSPGSSPAKRLPDAAINTLDSNFKKGFDSISGSLQNYFNIVVQSPLGVPFRKTFRRTVNVVVNGAPYSRASTIADAVNSLTGLAVKSLKEDTYGQFHKEVPDIIRAFVAAVEEIEKFMECLQVHWTDIDELNKRKADRKKDIPEVEAVLHVLKLALGKIMPAFSEFLEGMGMSMAEMRQAKKFAAVERLVMTENSPQKE